MTLRPATPADVPAVLPMMAGQTALHEAWDPRRFGYKPHAPSMYERWLRGQASDPRGVFLVAEREPSKIVGFLIGTIEHSIPVYRIEQFGFIHDMWVEADYRHEGIGRQLMMLAMEKYRELGITQVRLETAAQNEAARNLFQSCGFRVSAIEMLVDLTTESNDKVTR